MLTIHPHSIYHPFSLPLPSFSLPLSYPHSGPPYAIMDIIPKMGPVTGGTEIIIVGIDLVNTKDVTVRFGNFAKNYIDVSGTYISKTKISVISPDFQKYPPGEIDVRIALNGDTFTTTFQRFYFFSVTNAKNCIMYGPGLLNGCAIQEEISFVIQARYSMCTDICVFNQLKS